MPHHSPQIDKAVESPQDRLIDTVTASQQDALETFEAAGQAMFEGLTQVQHEIADFIAERIRQDMETQQELLRCRSLEDVRNVQARFFRTAFDQYAAETSRLVKLGGDMAARSLERNGH